MPASFATRHSTASISQTKATQQKCAHGTKRLWVHIGVLALGCVPQRRLPTVVSGHWWKKTRETSPETISLLSTMDGSQQHGPAASRRMAPLVTSVCLKLRASGATSQRAAPWAATRVCKHGPTNAWRPSLWTWLAGVIANLANSMIVGAGHWPHRGVGKNFGLKMRTRHGYSKHGPNVWQKTQIPPSSACGKMLASVATMERFARLRVTKMHIRSQGREAPCSCLQGDRAFRSRGHMFHVCEEWRGLSRWVSQLSNQSRQIKRGRKMSLMEFFQWSANRFRTWVCLKIWYLPNYSHLIGFRGTLFSDTPTCWKLVWLLRSLR